MRQSLSKTVTAELSIFTWEESVLPFYFDLGHKHNMDFEHVHSKDFKFF